MCLSVTVTKLWLWGNINLWLITGNSQFPTTEIMFSFEFVGWCVGPLVIGISENCVDSLQIYMPALYNHEL